MLFPFADYWCLYAGFTAAIVVLLSVDLGLFHRVPRAVGFRQAAMWTAVWVSVALAFDVALYQYVRWNVGWRGMSGSAGDALAWQTALEFLAGYVVEYSLSVDNIFVFVIVLRYFAVPAAYERRVLFYGILGALIFRSVFVALGAHLMRFHWVVWLFGGFLIVTGVKLMFAGESEIEPERNVVVRLLRRFVPVTSRLHGQQFFVRIDGTPHATPLFVALLFLETTDIIFAVDSVPAIFALTREPFVVFTSNVFAILGLRSLYFMLGGAVERFHLLRYGLAIVLIFVGLKMVWLNEWFGGKFPIGASLAIICFAIGASVVASLLVPKHPDATVKRARRVPSASCGAEDVSP